MSDYCTADEAKQLAIPEYKPGNAEQTAALAAMITAASRWVDRYTGRPTDWFAPAAVEPTTRRFRGDGRNVLRVPRHVGTPAITNPAVSASSVYQDSNGWIRYNDQFADGSDYFGSVDEPFFRYGQIYIVSARWGFESTPDEIKLATALIAGKIWDLGRGIIGQVTPTGFVIERDMPPAAKTILDTWKRKEGEIC
jgi:hypothetical protein